MMNKINYIKSFHGVNEKIDDNSIKIEILSPSKSNKKQEERIQTSYRTMKQQHNTKRSNISSKYIKSCLIENNASNMTSNKNMERRKSKNVSFTEDSLESNRKLGVQKDEFSPTNISKTKAMISKIPGYVSTENPNNFKTNQYKNNTLSDYRDKAMNNFIEKMSSNSNFNNCDIKNRMINAISQNKGLETRMIFKKHN